MLKYTRVCNSILEYTESFLFSHAVPTGKTTPLEDSTFDEYPRSVATPPPPPPHRKSRLESQQTPPIPPPPAPASSGPTSLPSMDVIQLSIKETTQRIQVLLKAAQSQRQNELVLLLISLILQYSWTYGLYVSDQRQQILMQTIYMYMYSIMKLKSRVCECGPNIDWR